MKKSGFTFIELMFVVAIIAFLAMVAIPSARRYLARAKRAEAYTMLSSIATAQKVYWAEHGKFSTQLGGDGGLGWKPEGYRGGGAQENFNYTYGFPGSEGVTFFTGKLNTPSSFLSAATVSDNGFVAVAAGDITGEGKPDILTIDNNGTIAVVYDSLQ